MRVDTARNHIELVPIALRGWVRECTAAVVRAAARTPRVDHVGKNVGLALAQLQFASFRSMQRILVRGLLMNTFEDVNFT